MILKNKSAIITGASRGFGLAIAKAFVKEGANVSICARNKKQLDEAKKELENLVQCNNQVLIFQADVSKPDEISHAISETIKQFKNLDILVANAGIYGPKGLVEDVNWEDWSNAIDINLKGVVLCCRAILPHFKEKKQGKIIILSGGGATKPMPYLSAYAASKAAVVRFAETLAHEVSNKNIEVNTVAPGALNTHMLDEILEAGPSKVGEERYQLCLKQKEEGGAPLETGAALCVFLASSKSNNITGKLISAIWDPWRDLNKYIDKLKNSDIYTLRRIIPEERGVKWK